MCKKVSWLLVGSCSYKYFAFRNTRKQIAAIQQALTKSTEFSKIGAVHCKYEQLALS
jgi:hypothetical protein